MNQFKCWIPLNNELPELNAMSVAVPGDDVGDAALKFMRRHEADKGHYYCGIHGVECDVYVRRLSDNKVFVVRVTGEALPTYLVGDEPKLLEEHCYNAPFYVNFTGWGGSECCFKYDTIETAKREAAYIKSAGGSMITITDNDDQYVPFEE